MELQIENNIENNLNQNDFLNTTLGKAINNGIDIGLRCILPNYIENQIIEIKDNLMKYGLKEGINKTIKDTIDLGKSAIGIFTGNFENISQIQKIIKNGGILDSISNLLDIVLERLKKSGKINYSIGRIIKNGKDSILNSVEDKLENTIKEQKNIEKNIDIYIQQWKDAYSNKNINEMEKAYKKIEIKIKQLVPIEEKLKEAREIENIHQLIISRGNDFNLTENDIDLIKNISA